MKLGSKVKDKVTGFQATVVARTEYLYGLPQLGVQGESKDGKQAPYEWGDETRFEPIDS